MKLAIQNNYLTKHAISSLRQEKDSSMLNALQCLSSRSVLKGGDYLMILS